MLRLGVIAWLGGLVLLVLLSHLPSPSLLVLFPIFIIGGLSRARTLLRILAWGGAGFLWGCGAALLASHDRFDPQWVDTSILLTGQIASVPEVAEDSQRFTFQVESPVRPATVHIPAKIRLSWRVIHPQLLPGQRWQLTVRLKPPHRYANPGSFDYEAWLWQQRIGATGYVRDDPSNVLLDNNTGAYPVQRYRQHLREILTQALGAQPHRNVVVALVLGMQSELDQPDWQLLRNTGTAHLLAISGLHIGMVATLCYLMTLWVVRRSVWLTQRMAAPRIAAIIGMLAAVGYSALAGFSLPTQRACLMLCVGFLGIYLHTRHSPSQVLALVLGVILLWDPFAVLNAGFWLSFGAVAIIYFLLVGGAQRHWPGWRQSLRLQWFISLGLIPLLVLFFGQFPLYSPLVNAIAIPFVTLLIVPVLLLGTLFLSVWPWLGGLLLSLGEQAIEGLWWLLGWVAGLPSANIAIPSVSPVAVLLAMGGVILVGLPRGLPCRWLGLLALVPLCFPALPVLDWGQVRLTLLDVGQGLSLVAETQRHVLVFDTGPRYATNFNLGEAVIVPFLRHQGRTHIDQLVVSHGDMDHIGGAEGLAHQLPVLNALSSVPAELTFVPVQRCEAGQRWQWDGVSFEVLHPVAADYTSNRKGNNRCCVLRIRTGQHQALVTADIEALAEHQLLARYGTQLASDILLVPHHGSRTSSTTAFLDVVQPRYAWVATGRFNRFHFPREDVVSRYREHGIQFYDTARDGAVSLVLGLDGYLDRPQGFRHQHQRIWHPPQ